MIIVDNPPNNVQNEVVRSTEAAPPKLVPNEAALAEAGQQEEINDPKEKPGSDIGLST